MKKIIYCLVLLSGTVNFVLAQGQSGDHSRNQQRGGMYGDTSRHQGMGAQGDMAEKRTAMLTKELALSPDQSAKVKALFSQQEQEMRTAWQNKSTTDTAALRKSRMAMFDKNQQDLKSILTQAQIAKLDTIRAERKEKFMYNRQHYMGQGQQGGQGGHGGHGDRR